MDDSCTKTFLWVMLIAIALGAIIVFVGYINNESNSPYQKTADVTPGKIGREILVNNLGRTIERININGIDYLLFETTYGIFVIREEKQK